jgi:hypothetical protein
MNIRQLINVLEEIEASADTAPVPSNSNVAPVPGVQVATAPVTTKPNPKAPPGGYAGKGEVRDFYKAKGIITNPEAWDQMQTKQGQEAWRQIQHGKYKGQDWKTLPMDLRKRAGIHDDMPNSLDAPWNYTGDNTMVVTPQGYGLSGSEHQGFQDPNAPEGILKIPPIKQLPGGGGDMHAVAHFLHRSGHDDDSIARSLRHYFPKITDQQVKTQLRSANDFNRAGYNVGKSIAIDSPHDHDANPMGPFSHSGAIRKIDPDVAERGLGIMYDNGRDRDEAQRSIKSAYRTKSGANTWHTYDEVDPQFEDAMQYAMANSYKIGNFTVSETDEIGDNGKPTGRRVIFAQAFGKYLGGPKGKGLGSMTSYWHGTPEQWKRDKATYLAHLKTAG